MKKIIKVCSLFLLLLSISGCGYVKIEVNNPLMEEDIIKYVQTKIFEETGDYVEPKIIEKDQLSVCIIKIDSTCYSQKVEGGFKYSLEIINNEDNSIKGTATYEDAYTIYDKQFDSGKKNIVSNFYSDYAENKGLFFLKSKLEKILIDNYSNSYLYYHEFYKRNFTMFIGSSNFNQIFKFINQLNIEISNDSVYSYLHIFIFDEKVFSKIDFKTYIDEFRDYPMPSMNENIIKGLTNKNAVYLGNSKGFNYDFFVSKGEIANDTNKYEDYNNFNYEVFVYDTSRSSYKDGRDTLYVYGVR